MIYQVKGIARSIMERLVENGYEAYLVGGAVRDYLLGWIPHDIDITTNAKPDEILEIFNDRKTSEVGKSFGVVLVDDIEVATYREDNYFGLDNRKVDIRYANSIKADLSRRDFTINAIAIGLNGEVVDPFGGTLDLENKVIRFVGNPYHRIYEDPNRIIRACRFAAMFGNGSSLQKEDATYNAIKDKASYVKDHVVPERIRLEIVKTMDTQKPSEFFYILREIGLLSYVFPSLDMCWGHEHGKYHTEDVFEHCMLCGDNLWKSSELLRLVGYLHDCGKPYCYDGEHFYEHELAGCDLVKDELKMLKFSNREIEYISQLIRLHMRYFGKMGPRGVRRTLRELDKYNIDHHDLLRLTMADWKASTPNRLEIPKVKHMIGAIKKELNRKGPESPYASLALNGYDIMKITGIPQSRRIGEILEALVESVLENPSLNTKEELIRVIHDTVAEGV